MSFRRSHRVQGERRKARLAGRKQERRNRTLASGVIVATLVIATAGAVGVNAYVAEREPDALAYNTTEVTEVLADSTEVQVKTEVVEEAVPHTQIERSDFSSAAGTRRVVQAGEPGTELVNYTVTIVDGVEIERERSVSVVVEEPQPEIVAVGQMTVPVVSEVERGSNRELGKNLAASLYGWSGEQWSCLSALWAKESGWSQYAHNKRSGAHGIPQALPGNKMSSFGGDWWDNPDTQIRWGLSYINGRYGSPCAAWGHSGQKGWY